MKKQTLLTIIFFCMTLIACNEQNRQQERQTNYLDNRLSLKLEEENIQSFFDRHSLDLTIDETKNVNPYRIFLHRFKASENQVVQIIKILELDSVTKKEFAEIHLNEFSNADFKIHSIIGQKYLKDPKILFYKAEKEHLKVQKELKVSKAYLYFNKRESKACFQVYYDWE